MSNLKLIFFAFLFLVCLTGTAAAQTPERIYMIGNSLTWDTFPHELYRHVEYHIDCSRNLQYIFDNPDAPCFDISRVWTDALVNDTYDTVVVQPFTGTTFAQDVAVISYWMELQPAAQFIIHTGWAEHHLFEQMYHTTTLLGDMIYSPAYFDALAADLLALHPERPILINDAQRLLDGIFHDIQAETAPFTSFSDLYRDHIHMSEPNGRYLMHNLMRLTLQQKMRYPDFPTITPQDKAYLDRKLCEHIETNYTAEPVTFNTHTYCHVELHTVFLPLIMR